MPSRPFDPEPTYHSDPPGTWRLVLAIALGCAIVIALIIGLPWWLTS